MNKAFRPLAMLFCITLLATACQKQLTLEDSLPGNNNNNNNGGATGNCNDVVMKLRRVENQFADHDFIDLQWNADNTIRSINMSTNLSNYYTAEFKHEGGKITEAILFDSDDRSLIDTVIYHYNVDGLVDSIYWKNDDWFDVSLKYENKKLVRYNRYMGGNPGFYLLVNTDGNGNVIKSEEYTIDGNGQSELVNTHTWQRDQKKNPLADFAPYMIPLDDPYNIFWYWGPNNYTEQVYTNHSLGLVVPTGHAFKYNENCYPVSNQTTLGDRFSAQTPISCILTIDLRCV